MAACSSEKFAKPANAVMRGSTNTESVEFTPVYSKIIPSDNTAHDGAQVQTSFARVTNGGMSRTPLRNSYAAIRPPGMMESSLIIYHGVGQLRSVLVSGRHCIKRRLVRQEEDADPSFADNCIFIQDPTEATILAFPSAAALEHWCDQLCSVGCIMRDFTDHFTRHPGNLDDLRLVRSISARRVSRQGELFAIKARAEPEKKTRLMKEFRLLRMLNHPGIPRAYGMYSVLLQGEPGLGMVVDFKAGSDLSTWIPTDGLPEWALQGIIAQISGVLLYLHRNCIAHRNIKPSNVLCEMGEDTSVKVCLADFGLAAYVQDTESLATPCGSPGYIAPEIFTAGWREAFSSPAATPQALIEKVFRTDIFSFGMLIYVAVFGVNPFLAPTLQETMQNNARGIINVDPGLTVALQNLIASLVTPDPGSRCSIFDVAEHPWFQADLRALGFAGADEDLRRDSISWQVFEHVANRRND